MIVAGLLAVLVAFIGTSSVLSKQERLIYEVVASFFVGLVSGLIALTWPDHTCFASMAIAGILDIMQGFRVVYAIIEIMSKHTVSGTADLMEGILFKVLSHLPFAMVSSFRRPSKDNSERPISKTAPVVSAKCGISCSFPLRLFLGPVCSPQATGIYSP